MEISDYEQYYQKGGTYVLPIEVFNELWGEMDNWKNTCKQKENIITKYKLIIKALYQHYHEHEYYELYEFLKQLESCTENDMNWLKKMAGENDE